MRSQQKSSALKYALTTVLVVGGLYGCGDNEVTGEPKAAVKTTSAKSAAPDFHYVTLEKQTPADTSPVGYWEANLKYPQFINSDNTPALSAINTAITATVNSYKCDGPGDQGFDAAVSFSDSRLFSVKYEVMWMCSTMADLDSDIGAQVYDVSSGALIRFEQQLKDTQAVQQVNTMIDAKIKAALASLDASLACPAPEQEKPFYIEDGRYVFMTRFLAHADSACEVEVEIPRSDLASYLKAGSVLAQ